MSENVGFSQSKRLSGKRILALTKYAENGASSRMRTLQYLPALRAAGAEVHVSSFFETDYIYRLYSGKRRKRGALVAAYLNRLKVVSMARHYDLLWIEKELFPYFPGIFERLPRFMERPYIVDYDDAIFHNYDLHHSALVRRLLGHKLRPLLRGAAMVTAGNEYLASYALEHGAQRVVLMPTTVDLTKYSLARPLNSDAVRVAWIGTPNTVKYLIEILPVLVDVSTVAPITLVTIGAPPIGVHPSLKLEQHSWSAISEATILASADIGIMPLPDEPFERGKCGYKLIQYMACGLPVIASPVGVNREIVDGTCGFVAQTVEEWRDRLLRMCENSHRRAIMGAAGRAKVEAEYCVQVTAPRLISLIEDFSHYDEDEGPDDRANHERCIFSN